MNVAIFASAFYPSLGGVEELCRQLALEYQRRGLGVIVLTNRWPRDLPAFENIDGIDVHRLAMRVPTSSVKSKISYALTGAAVRREMLGILQRLRPDLLHVQCVSCNAAYALRAKRVLGVPLVVTLQGELTMDASQVFQREAWAKRVMRESLEEADAITACSRQTLQEAEAWLGKPFGGRGRVIYNGIAPADASAEPFEHPRPYILAIGRHVPQKGFDLLLRAMAKLVEDPAFGHDLILAGDGAEHHKLRELTAELKLGNRVVFPGRVDHPMAMRLFAGCSFFVLPSRHEPFGIVNLEAMAAGKAIAATRVGGVSEIVEDGVNGLLVAGEDVEGLVIAIWRMAKDASLRNRLGQAGKERVRHFTWPAIADQYLDVYRQVIDEKALVACAT
jgi:glycosyltransferase involved in cell wall biosynthesis